MQRRKREVSNELSWLFLVVLSSMPPGGPCRGLYSPAVGHRSDAKRLSLLLGGYSHYFTHPLLLLALQVRSTVWIRTVNLL
jgi:hypothetical protein